MSILPWHDGDGDFDYLSSIEVCLVHHSDVILMQNWDHVNEILSLLNKDPVNNNGTDFSRVRKMNFPANRRQFLSPVIILYNVYATLLVLFFIFLIYFLFLLLLMSISNKNDKDLFLLLFLLSISNMNDKDVLVLLIAYFK